MNEVNQSVSNGSRHSNLPEMTFLENTKTRSMVVTINTVLALLFFVTTVIFLAFFIYTHIKYDEQAPATGRMCSTRDCDTSAPETDEVCNTPECITAAARMLQNMNLSVDPCVNFHEFACGSFVRETQIPDGTSGVNAFRNGQAENKLLLKNLVSADVVRGEPLDLTKMKNYYKDCNNGGLYQRSSIIPYLTSTYARDWPTLNKSWTGDNFQLSSVIAHYNKLGIAPIYYYYAYKDMKDFNNISIYVTYPLLGLPREYFSQPRNDTIITTYQQYLANLAIKLGASTADANQDAKDVVDLEIAISEIMTPREELLDDNKKYNPVTLERLSTFYPELNVSTTLKEAFKSAKLIVHDDQAIIIHFPTYMGNISRVINKFSTRTLQNLFSFKYAASTVGISTREMIVLISELSKVLQGHNGLFAEWELCLELLARQYNSFVEQFFQTSFNYATYIQEIADNLKPVFKDMFEKNTWIGPASKEKVINKLMAIKFNLKSPTGVGEKILETKVKQHTAPDNNDNSIGRETLKDQLKRNVDARNLLWKPRHVKTTSNIGYVVNALYETNGNQIYVTPGIMKAPFFTATSQDYLNYGGIGMVVAHEIAHGFDNHEPVLTYRCESWTIGDQTQDNCWKPQKFGFTEERLPYHGQLKRIQYDERGNLRRWLDKADTDKLSERIQCIINQTSSFFMEEINMSLNGVYMQGEALADNVGLRQSFRAYKEVVHKQGQQPRLPVLNLTQDQLFFLSSSQVWCDKYTKESRIYFLRTDSHPPGVYRIIGTLQNSEDFAKAYNCPRGSYMNPEKKCSVW